MVDNGTAGTAPLRPVLAPAALWYRNDGERERISVSQRGFAVKIVEFTIAVPIPC